MSALCYHLRLKIHSSFPCCHRVEEIEIILGRSCFKLLCHYYLTTTLVTYQGRPNTKFQREKCMYNWAHSFQVLSELMQIYEVLRFFQCLTNVLIC
jgi:hypothetical protein